MSLVEPSFKCKPGLAQSPAVAPHLTQSKSQGPTLLTPCFLCSSHTGPCVSTILLPRIPQHSSLAFFRLLRKYYPIYNRTTEDEMVGLTQWTWVWVNSGSWRWTREAWRAAVHGVTKSWTWLSNWTELRVEQRSSGPTLKSNYSYPQLCVLPTHTLIFSIALWPSDTLIIYWVFLP